VREQEMRRRHEIRAAARLVHTDLGAAELAAASDAKNRSVAALSALSPDAWTTHRGLLASELSDAAYDTVADACMKVLLTVTIAAQITTLDEDLPAELFDKTLQEMQAILRGARETLAPVAYPDLGREAVSAD
jgi:hypothetical protein